MKPLNHPITKNHRTTTILLEVAAERRLQDEKWGEQNHPDGTNRSSDSYIADAVKEANDRAVKKNCLTWRLILEEEVAEVFAEQDEDKIYAELIQVAAVASAWAEAIKRRKA